MDKIDKIELLIKTFKTDSCPEYCIMCKQKISGNYAKAYSLTPTNFLGCICIDCMKTLENEGIPVREMPECEGIPVWYKRLLEKDILEEENTRVWREIYLKTKGGQEW